jgi:dihydropteroate synthase
VLGPAARRDLDAFGDLPPSALYLRPLGLASGAAAAAAVAAGLAWRIAGGWTAASLVEVVARRAGGVDRLVLSAPDFAAWLARAHGPVAARLRLLAERVTAPRASWAGLGLDRPIVMGIVNTTPDSFSDGGDYDDPEAAIAHGLELRAAGAEILDVGGESTRPGAAPVSVDEEIRRIVPVIRGLRAAGALVSVDARRAPVMAAALEAGARIINDIQALNEPGALALAARTGAPTVLMHMRGEPGTMQVGPRYDAAALDVFDWLEARIEACEAAGIPRRDLLVDPGIGFGKEQAHNFELLTALGLLHATGCGILLGVSRKSFIGRLVAEPDAKRRLGGSLAAALDGLAQGAQIFRVHDVFETAQALRVVQAIGAAAIGEPAA